jgi:hypothetical protein
MKLTPKNWSAFQHYRDRKPAWIKLHRGLLDDYEFACLPVASRALAPMLWLLASEYQDGAIDASEAEIAFRARMSVADLVSALTPLIDKGFFVASNMLAECKHVAIPEREKEREGETEKQEQKKDAAPQPSSLEKQLYDRGKAVLGGTAGGLIRNLVKAKNGDVALARAAIETASTKQDPREYVSRIVAGRDEKPYSPII